MYRYYGIMTANKYGIDICVEHKPIYRIANLCTVLYRYFSSGILAWYSTGMYKHALCGSGDALSSYYVGICDRLADQQCRTLGKSSPPRKQCQWLLILRRGHHY